MARSKKEIDKELMYKKIMPSNTVNDEEPAETALTPAAAPSVNSAAPAAPTEMPAQAEAVPAAPEAALEAPSPAPQAPAITTAAPQAPQTAPAPPENEPVNIMELLLESRLDAAMEKFRCCMCDKCRKDVIAITLNKLPPYYIATQDAAKMAAAEAKYAGQVATALVQAILVVKSHPSHE